MQRFTYKRFLETVFLIAAVIGMAGCSSNQSMLVSNDSGDAYTNRFFSKYSNAFFYLQPDGMVKWLDYDSMQEAPLCNKPNCRHITDDCIETQINQNTPVFSDSNAYFFEDEAPEFVEGENGKTELRLGTTLWDFDFSKWKKTKLTQLQDVSVSTNCYGMLLHENTLYFITNALSRSYDENGMLVGYGGSGGEMNLYSFNLSTNEMTNHCRLYDVERLKEYYPLAPISGESYMKGLFDNKIYFNVGFVVKTADQERYQFYVTYYDLSDGTYHGTPEDYEQIDFAAVSYASDDYLVICRDGAAWVYKKGSDQPIMLEDTCFNQDASVAVYDDVLFYYDKAFDLNSGNVRKFDFMREKEVVAKYGNSFIIADCGMQSGFEKIPAEKLQ